MKNGIFKSAEYKVIPVDSDTRMMQVGVNPTKENITVLRDISNAVSLEYNKIPQN